MASATKQVVKEVPTVIRVYDDGSVERLMGSPYVPPSLDKDPETEPSSVSSKDVTISENPKISARLYLPKSTRPDEKLPVLVYFHGGAFCIESAFSFLDHRYLNAIASEARVLAVSVEYRLAPESPLPAAYEDCWESLQWVTRKSDPWISDHADFDRIYIGGDSAGGNIVHNIAMRAGEEGLNNGTKVLGGFLSHPYFWGSGRVGNEVNDEKSLERLVWKLVYPAAPGGIDNPMINPGSPGAPGLGGLGLGRVLVCVAGKDNLRDRGVWYYEMVKESGWKGEVELFESEGEAHAFHIYNIETENAKKMIKRLASFLTNK